MLLQALLSPCEEELRPSTDLTPILYNLLHLPHRLLLTGVDEKDLEYPRHLLNPELVLGTRDVVRGGDEVAEEGVEGVLEELLLIDCRDHLIKHTSFLL